jgi:hypothetical protein
VGVKRWRKKAEERSVWAMILKKALVKLVGPYDKEDKKMYITPLTESFLRGR